MSPESGHSWDYYDPRVHRWRCSRCEFFSPGRVKPPPGHLIPLVHREVGASCEELILAVVHNG